MKKRTDILLVLIIAIMISSCGQKKQYPYKISDFRPELRSQLDKLANEKQLPSKDTVARNFLRFNCSKNELIKILNCENPLLRIIAYRTIVNRNEKDCFDILLTHLNDTAKINWWFEDVCNTYSVSDLMIIKVVGDKGLTPRQKSDLVDSVLTKHIYLDVAQEMMEEIKPQERYYSIIRQQCQIKTKGEYPEELTYALAKSGKAKDISIIKRNIDYNRKSYYSDFIFRTIELFPDTAFFSVLQDYYKKVIMIKKQDNSDELKFYFRAVAKYKSIKSLSILVSLTKKENYPDAWCYDSNINYLYRAISRYSAPIYDKLNNELRPRMDDYTIKSANQPEYEKRTTW